MYGMDISPLDFIIVVGWLLIAPVLIPMTAGGIAGWFIPRTHVMAGVGIGLITGVLAIPGGWYFAFRLSSKVGWEFGLGAHPSGLVPAQHEAIMFIWSLLAIGIAVFLTVAPLAIISLVRFRRSPEKEQT